MKRSLRYTQSPVSSSKRPVSALSLFPQDTTAHEPFPLDAIHELVQIERSSRTPLYLQISQGLREAILTGELVEGLRLPTERALAQALGVNRTTIMNAYDELSSEGLIEGHVGRGTIVRHSYQQQPEAYFAQEDQESPSWLLGLASSEDAAIGQDARMMGELISAARKREVIAMNQSMPALDTQLTDLVRTVVDEGLDQAREQALGFCPVEGAQSLRRCIAARMRRRGLAVDLKNILILSGSTQGLGLIGRLLLNPGDEVIVEVPTYLGAIQTMRALGARIIGIPVDNDGMRVDLLEAVLARRQPRFIYTLPTFQNPTGAVMSLERRRRLLQLSQQYQVPILEDDPYSELYFTEEPPQPLKALDTYGNVLYISTYSKLLAPGLRVAWLVAPETVIERLALHKQIFDLNTNALGQWIVSEILSRPEFEIYLTRMRQSYARKLDLMLSAIRDYWPVTVRIQPPAGGMHLWCRLPAEIRARTLLREAAQEQVTFMLGTPLHVDGGGHSCIRLSFAALSEDEIVEGVRRIGVALERLLVRRAANDEEPQPIDRLPMI